MRTSCLRWSVEKDTQTHSSVQPSQLLPTKHLPAFNNCGTTRETSDVFDRYEMYFCAGKCLLAASFLLQCPILCIVIVCVCVNLTLYIQWIDQSRTCSLASAKRGGKHSSVTPRLSFSHAVLLLVVVSKCKLAACFLFLYVINTEHLKCGLLWSC